MATMAEVWYNVSFRYFEVDISIEIPYLPRVDQTRVNLKLLLGIDRRPQQETEK
jgi:hypothetical protein